MEVLVTGGNGLLGRHLVTSLIERGDSIRVLALEGEDTSWLDERGVSIYRGDVRNQESVSTAASGVGTVFHLAGMMGVWRPLDDYRSVNVTGTSNVCRAALAAGAGRLVHVSSWTVYGMATGSACDEDFPVRPFPEPYAITKSEGDELVQRFIREEGLPAAIVRPGTFFGPGDVLHFGRIADRLAGRKAVVVGKGDNALPFVYVTDVVQGLLLASERPEAVGQAFNITNDDPLTQQEFLDAVAAETGAPLARVHVPYAPLYAAGFAAERFAAITRSRRQPPVTRLGVKLFGTDNRHAIGKARTVLGYEPQVSLREGVRLAADWYCNRQLIAP